MEFYQSIEKAKASPLLEKIAGILETLDLATLEKGTHPVDDTCYFNVIGYDSTTPDKRAWESHRREYDIHYIISGDERVYHNYLDQMTLGEYVEKDDWQQMEGDCASELILRPGNILILDANDAHKTGLKAADSVAIRKIVFKVAM